MKSHLILLVNREIKIKTMIKLHYLATSMTKINMIIQSVQGDRTIWALILEQLLSGYVWNYLLKPNISWDLAMALLHIKAREMPTYVPQGHVKNVYKMVLIIALNWKQPKCLWRVYIYGDTVILK